MTAYTWVHLNAQRGLEHGFKLGFEPGLRTRASFCLLLVTNYKWSAASRPWGLLNHSVYESVINWLTTIYILSSKSIAYSAIYTWIILSLKNQNFISYSSAISAAFTFKQKASIAFKFNQMCLFMNNFVALIREEIGVEHISRPLVKSLGLSLYRCSTVISIGCPGIVWSLELLACFVNAPLHTNSDLQPRKDIFRAHFLYCLVMTFLKNPDRLL